jgi:hypothetical protein
MKKVVQAISPLNKVLFGKWAAASLPLLIFLLSFSVGDVFSSVLHDARESSYEVFSHGLRIGEVKTVCGPVARERGKAFRFESLMHIDARFVFFSYTLDKKEEAMVGSEGTLSYRRTSQENGKNILVAGRMEDGVFRFHITENGEKRTLVIPRRKYDYTSLDCPETALGSGEREKTLRILDLENLEIVTRKYRWVREEDVRVGDRRIHCKVIDFEDSNKKGRRWVDEDELGILVTRQDGTGKGVSYSSRLTSLAVKSRPGFL